MTLQEAKDQVAQKHYYNNWESLCKLGNHDGTPDKWIDEVAELYARSKWDEGFDASIKKFEYAKSKAKTLVELVQLDAVLTILDVTKNEFNP